MTLATRTPLITISILLTSMLSLSAWSKTASAAVDTTPDCDTVAVIRCGAFSADEMRRKASRDDVPKIFNALAISQADLKGEFKNGIVWKDGRVTVGDRVVATDAMTAGRNFGGTPIDGTNAGTYPTSRFVSDGQTAFVRMVDGKFDFAVIKACGNPVKATPKSPPKQPEQPPKVPVVTTKTPPTPPTPRPETPPVPEAPQTIAETGPVAIGVGIVGSGALSYGLYAYLQSRRYLIDKLMNS